MNTNFLNASVISFDINNISLNAGYLLLMVVIIIVILLILYLSKTNIGFKLRKKIGVNFSKYNNNDDYKKLVNILFIDDKDIPVAQTLEEDDWKVEKIRDAQIDDEKIKKANIIFVDWKGVGRKISSEEEGISLANSIKNKYKNKKYIILYSAREYQKPEGIYVDDWMNKGSDYSTYSKMVQKASFVLFG